MQMNPPALPCSAAEPCPVLSFVWPPAVGWLWITSVSVAHRIRWDGGFKNKMDPIINKEKTPVMHPVNYPLSILEDNIKMGTKQTRAQQLLKQRQVPGVSVSLCAPLSAPATKLSHHSPAGCCSNLPSISKCRSAPPSIPPPIPNCKSTPAPPAQSLCLPGAGRDQRCVKQEPCRSLGDCLSICVCV